MNDIRRVAAVGAGRMGRGVAIVFAYAGYDVDLIDLKIRSIDGFNTLQRSARNEIASTLNFLSEIGMMPAEAIDPIVSRLNIVDRQNAEAILVEADVVFEAVPETLEAKKDALGFLSETCRLDAIIASTTSTILSDELQEFVSGPGRFLNAHWLNPAYLVPLVELSPASETHPAVADGLKSLLERIGKVPVVCKASPGYIVPRIQALAMNEAARLVEQGVATADDIDKATKYGFGFRFAVLGLLEFIDWGGGDILFHASRNLNHATGEDRFAAPQIIERNMAENRIGLRTGTGFRDYSDIDTEAYRRDRLDAFVRLLNHFGMIRPPVL